jgi:hypothetical protein
VIMTTGPRLEREIFRTSRLIEFCSRARGYKPERIYYQSLPPSSGATSMQGG